MKTTNLKVYDDMSVERGRRLVRQAFSPDHQRLRSPGDMTPLIKRVTTTDRSHCGGFHPTRCNAPSQKPAKYSQPPVGRIEGVGSILREIRSLPEMSQIWLHFMYKSVTNKTRQRKLHQLLFLAYRQECGLLNANTLQIINGMAGEHLRYLSGMDVPREATPSRRDASLEISNIEDTSWTRTYREHWEKIYGMILHMDRTALCQVDEIVQ